MSKPFECENGFIYQVPDDSCYICDHCTDIWYDYTHGPYMSLCDLGIKRYSQNQKCKFFIIEE